MCIRMCTLIEKIFWGRQKNCRGRSVDKVGKIGGNSAMLALLSTIKFSGRQFFADLIYGSASVIFLPTSKYLFDRSTYPHTNEDLMKLVRLVPSLSTACSADLFFLDLSSFSSLLKFNITMLGRYLSVTPEN